jgi:hypothetical protein
MSPKEIHKTSWIHLKSSPLTIALRKNGLLNLRGTERAFDAMSGLGGQKRPPTIKLPKLCTIWSCATESETCEVGISFGSVQAILTDERFLLDESTDS